MYLDNAATTQKPKVVLDAMQKFYKEDNANVKRGMHVLAERSTEVYEAARTRVKKFLHAKHAREIIFTRNATEGINLVARSWGEANLKRGDTVLLTLLEHHSNIVPWLQLKEKLGVNIEWVGIDPDGTLNMDELSAKLKGKKVKIVATTCVSNVLGVITPHKEIVKRAHKAGALCLLDAAQLAPHAPIDVQEIDCDFLVFSGHKVYGPTGIGVLYGKEKHLKAMPPFLGGGSMIQEVFKDRFTSASLPEKFEAGTPPIAEACGLHAALDFLEKVGWKKLEKHERELLRYALEKLKEFPMIEILGPQDPKKIASCISFVTCNEDLPENISMKFLPSNPEGLSRAEERMPVIHPHDLTEYLGRKGVCLRAGHHCCQPLHETLGHAATTRLSVGIYNTKEDIDRMCEVLEEAFTFFLGTT